jgi:hypothetical protein
MVHRKVIGSMRRAARFEGWLKLMYRRTHQIRHGDCYIIFDIADADCGDWRKRGEEGRYVQFLFRRDWFMVDLPNSTLLKSEAERLLRERSGYFWQRDQPKRTNSPQYIPEFDPLNKAYLYRDERSAALDVEWLLSNVWGIRHDAKITVRAESFGDNTCYWECRTPLSGHPVRLTRYEKKSGSRGGG